MRIAFIGQKGIPALSGGIEQHVEEVAKRLAKRGHDVSVFVRSWYTPEALRQYEHVRLVHTPTIATKHLDAALHSLTSSLRCLLARYDIVHYHGIGPCLFAWISRLGGHQVVVTVHRLDWQAAKWGGAARVVLRAAEELALLTAHRVIAVSRALRRHLQAKCRKPIHYIPNGIDCKEHVPPEIITERYGLAGSDYVLFLGRLVPEKRVHWLIKAFQTAQGRLGGTCPKLVVAGGSSGSDDYVTDLRQLAADSTDIIFTGAVAGREKEELLGNARVFVLPSSLEGHPIALLEAMAHGRLCLASDIEANREVITDGVNGLLFSSSDFDDLVEKLCAAVADHGSFERVGRQAQEDVRSYDWDCVVDELEMVYLEVGRRDR